MENSRNGPVMDAYHGACVIFPQGLQKSGIADDLDRLSFQAMVEVLGLQKAQEVISAGAERMHKIAPVSQLIQVNRRLNQLCQRSSLETADGILRNVFGYTRPVYISSQMIARFMFPFSLMDDHERSTSHQQNSDRCCGGTERGRTRPLQPHRDYWFDLPKNTMNIWIAMSDVIAGNGLAIYPELFGKEVSHNQRVIDSACHPGEPMGFQMNKGDILLFNGDHLHGTEPNFTDRTRVSFSLRFYLSRPKEKPPPGLYFYNSRFISSPVRDLFRVPSKAPWSNVKRLPLRVLSACRHITERHLK